MSRAYALYVSNTCKFHARYRHVEYAMNTFGTRFRHASVRYIVHASSDFMRYNLGAKIQEISNFWFTLHGLDPKVWCHFSIDI